MKASKKSLGLVFSALLLALLIPLETPSKGVAVETNYGVTDTLPVSVLLLAHEEERYAEARANLPRDMYMFYRVIERLIRANNLDFPYWKTVLYHGDRSSAQTYGTYTVIFEDSLLDLLEGNVSAVTFVIAHEMAHYQLNHMARAYQFYQELEDEMMAELGEDASLEDVWGVMFSGTPEMERRIEEFQQSLELEADREALNYMARAGANPEGAVETLLAFQQIYGMEENLTDRIEVLQGLIDQGISEELMAVGERHIAETAPLPYELSEDETQLKVRLHTVDYATNADQLFGP